MTRRKAGFLFATPIDRNGNIWNVVDMDYHRRSIRLPRFDYGSAGAYFVTICTHERAHVFGKIQNDEMILNENGNICMNVWDEIQEYSDNAETDEFIVMPNHVHGIIWIRPPTHGAINPKGAINRAPTTTTMGLGEIVRSYKARVTRQIRLAGSTYGVWQRNYYERIIRNERELHAIRQYIRNNPSKWEFDGDHSSSS
jgi:REP element-mobilizing transposase RayT